MIQTTRWKPDTCQCEFEYEWDDSVPEDQRVHTFSNALSQCDLHKGLPQDATLYDNVLKENQTKNLVLGDVLEKVPRLKKEKTNDDGSTVEVLDPTVKYKWSFEGADDQRKLVVDLEGANLTPEEKTEIATVAHDKEVEVV